MCSDGVWEFLESDDAARLCSQRNKEAGVQEAAEAVSKVRSSSGSSGGGF
jgi:serine/threonine protein phosphatase PrpC